eukprot:1083490-Prorocentrum_minimum.AAC.1
MARNTRLRGMARSTASGPATLSSTPMVCVSAGQLCLCRASAISPSDRSSPGSTRPAYWPSRSTSAAATVKVVGHACGRATGDPRDIITMNQSDAGSAGIFSRWTKQTQEAWEARVKASAGGGGGRGGAGAGARTGAGGGGGRGGAGAGAG